MLWKRAAISEIHWANMHAVKNMYYSTALSNINIPTCYFYAFENINKLKNDIEHITISYINITINQISKIKQ